MIQDVKMHIQLANFRNTTQTSCSHIQRYITDVIDLHTS